MSSHQITVAQLIEKLKEYPPDLLVAVPSPCDNDKLYEGILDGPSVFEIIPVADVRTGFNPTSLLDEEKDWDVLLIRTNPSLMHWDPDNH